MNDNNDIIIAVRRAGDGKQVVEMEGSISEASKAIVYITAAFMQVLSSTGRSEALGASSIRSLVELGLIEYRKHLTGREPYELEVWEDK